MAKKTPTDIPAMRREIEAERARLADTVAALAYRANVPARVKEDLALRVAAAKRSAFGAPRDEPPAAADALQPGVPGDDGAMLALESAADAVEALGIRSNVFARYASRNPVLVAVGAVAVAVVLALAFAARRTKPDGRDAAA